MTALARTEWFSFCVPDRLGEFAYVEMIRSPDDPERKPRGARDPLAWRKDLKKHPSVWADRVLDLLADGKSRTLNAIGVDLIDMTADIIAGSSLGECVWALVEAGAIEFTMSVPVFFRRAIGPALEPDFEAALARVDGEAA